MNVEALKQLAVEAKAWAKAYTTLVEALQAEGVPEDVARQEARSAANMAMLIADEVHGDACPFCGD